MRLYILSKVEIMDPRHEGVVSRISKRFWGRDPPVDLGEIKVAKNDNWI